MIGLPEFGEVKDVSIESTYVEVEFHDRDRFNKNTFLGYGRVPLVSLLEEEDTAKGDVDLKRSEQIVILKKRQQRDIVRGNVQLRIKFVSIPSKTARAMNGKESRRTLDSRRNKKMILKKK